jgi:hypothetical protein
VAAVFIVIFVRSALSFYSEAQNRFSLTGRELLIRSKTAQSRVFTYGPPHFAAEAF